MTAPATLTAQMLFRDFVGYSDRLADGTNAQTGHIDFNNPNDGNGAIQFGIPNADLGNVVGDDGVTRRVPTLAGTAGTTYVSGTREGPPHTATSFSDYYVQRVTSRWTCQGR